MKLFDKIDLNIFLLIRRNKFREIFIKQFNSNKIWLRELKFSEPKAQ